MQIGHIVKDWSTLYKSRLLKGDLFLEKWFESVGYSFVYDFVYDIA